MTMPQTTLAQLWERNRVELDIFSINVQHYLQYHAKIGFLGHPMGASGTI